MDLQLRCSLSVFLAAGSLRWGSPVSQAMFARATGLTPTTVSKLANDVLIEINIKTVGLLCAYFWCQPGDILRLTGEMHEQRILSALRRPERPDVVDPLDVISHIPTKLAQAPERVRQLTLARTTVWRLQHTTPARLSSETLIALAKVFDTTNITDFLSVDLPSLPAPA